MDSMDYIYKRYSVSQKGYKTELDWNSSGAGTLRTGAITGSFNPTGRSYTFDKQKGFIIQDLIDDNTYVRRNEVFYSTYHGTASLYRYTIMSPGYAGDRLEVRRNWKTSEYVFGPGAYIDEITAPDGTYPRDGRSGNYWYVRDRVANQAPTISGNDLDLGGKTSDFEVEYIINDEPSDTVKVDIYEDTKKVISAKPIDLGVRYTHQVDINDFTLGRHTIRIVATDSHGESATRTYTFTKVNSAPTLTSSYSEELGEKNSPFTLTYQVDDLDKDRVSVTETLNGSIIATKSNVSLKTTQSVTINEETLKSLTVGEINTLEIKADDGKGGISYLRFTFVRTNRPPIISDSDRDLGEKTIEPFTVKYSVSDIEKDSVDVRIYLDDKVIDSIEDIQQGRQQEIQITKDQLLELDKGKHTIRIVATDERNAKSERVYTFTRKIGKIHVIAMIKKTDIRATKVLFIPQYRLFEDVDPKEVIQIRACNNYLSSKPTWEDITEVALLEQTANLRNTTQGVMPDPHGHGHQQKAPWCVAVEFIMDARGELTGGGGAIS